MVVVNEGIVERVIAVEERERKGEREREGDRREGNENENGKLVKSKMNRLLYQPQTHP